MSNDIVDLILSLTKRATNLLESREDELLHILTAVNDSFSISESTAILTKNSHPVHYDDAEAIYDRCTYA